MAGKKKCTKRKPYKTPKYANDALLKRRGGVMLDKRDKVAEKRYMAEITARINEMQLSQGGGGYNG